MLFRLVQVLETRCEKYMRYVELIINSALKLVRKFNHDDID